MKRIIIPIVGQGSITHVIRTGILEGIKEFCKPIVVFLWNQEDLIKELQQKGYETYCMPAYSASERYSMLRSKINIWYYKYVLKTPSTKIKDNFNSIYYSPKKKLKKKIFVFTEQLKFFFLNGYKKKLLNEEKETYRNEKAYKEYKKWLEKLDADGLYTVTPFLQEIELIARLCKEKNLPVIASIHSFDNITKRAWPAIFFDHYIVWNKYNKSELQRINPSLSDNNITIAGAPQFDFHFNLYNFKTKAQWFESMGIKENKKIILYGGGAANLFWDEPQYLKDLHDAVKEGLFQEDVVILFRSHPLDTTERWKKCAGESQYIVYDEGNSNISKSTKLDHKNVTVKDVEKLICILQYTDVHINFCSTMTVDGSVFNKPQIGPAYHTNRHTQKYVEQFYNQEHFTPILKSNAIHLVHSKEEFIHLAKESLQEPEKFNFNCKKCVEEIITYTDGKSAHRVINILKAFFSS